MRLLRHLACPVRPCATVVTRPVGCQGGREPDSGHSDCVRRDPGRPDSVQSAFVSIRGGRWSFCPYLPRRPGENRNGHHTSATWPSGRGKVSSCLSWSVASIDGLRSRNRTNGTAGFVAACVVVRAVPRSGPGMAKALTTRGSRGQTRKSRCGVRSRQGMRDGRSHPCSLGPGFPVVVRHSAPFRWFLLSTLAPGH